MKTKVKDGRTDGTPADSGQVATQTSPVELTISGPGLRKLQFPSGRLPRPTRSTGRSTSPASGTSGSPSCRRAAASRLRRRTASGAPSRESASPTTGSARIRVEGLGEEQARLDDKSIFVARASEGTLSLDAYRKGLPAGRDDDVTVRYCVSDVVIKDESVRQIVIRNAADELPSATGVFSAVRKDGNLVLRRRSPHLYYISGIQDKEDITDEWNSEFRAAADAVREDRRSLLDYDRLYTIWQMVRNVRSSDAPMLEVGVLRGGTSAFLARAGAP